MIEQPHTIEQCGEPIVHQRVRFHGQIYWWHDLLLSPLDHYSDDGDLLVNPFSANSYAVVDPDGTVLRCRRVIGHMSEFELVTNDEQARTGLDSNTKCD
jgi:hypothetical protein